MRILIVNVTVSALVLAAAAVIAFGAYPQDTVTVYTGCLTSGGTITSLAASPTTPTKPCAATDQLIHLSGGTITKVTAGTGLTGGGSNGYVALGLDPAYSLPQSCVAGNFPGWSGSLWQCYGAGTGLTADTAGKKLGIATTYQLPQTCTNGQITKSGGPNTAWTCGNQQTYSGSDFALSNQGCSSGQFVTGINSTGHTNCANDQTYSGADFALSNQNCTSGQFATGVDGTGHPVCAAPPTNATHAYSVSLCCGGGNGVSLFDFGTTTVVTLNLPAGNFVLFGKVSIVNNDHSDQDANCTLRSGGNDLDKSETRIDNFPVFGGRNDDQQVVSLLTTLSLQSAGSVDLNCATQDGFAFDASLAALAVTNLN
jgi:hypothetical protein